MLLIMGTVLGVASTLIEIKLVHGVPVVARWYEHGIRIGKWKIEGIVLNTAGSFILSYLVGLMFAADGVTVLFGAIASTVLSQMYFSAESYCHSMGWSWAALKQGTTNSVQSFRRAKSSVTAVWHDFRQPVKDFMSLVLAFLKIVTYPLVLLRRASVAYSRR